MRKSMVAETETAELKPQHIDFKYPIGKPSSIIPGKVPGEDNPPSPRATWASGYHAMVEQGRGMERRATSSPNREESRHG